MTSTRGVPYSCNGLILSTKYRDNILRRFNSTKTIYSNFSTIHMYVYLAISCESQRIYRREKVSLWSYLNDKDKDMISHLYDDQLDEVLYPKSELVNMQRCRGFSVRPRLIIKNYYY